MEKGNDLFVILFYRRGSRGGVKETFAPPLTNVVYYVIFKICSLVLKLTLFL